MQDRQTRERHTERQIYIYIYIERERERKIGLDLREIKDCRQTGHF